MEMGELGVPLKLVEVSGELGDSLKEVEGV